MGREKKSPSTRTKVLRVLEHLDGPLPLRAVPVAFPIRKVVHSVDERQPLEMGLVERYVVEAARRFGPLSADDVAGLLGLESGLVRRVVLSLSGDHGAIACDGDVVTASPERPLPPHEVVTHDRAFAVAGLGGALLPVDAVQTLESSRLDPDGARERFKSVDGEDVHVRGSFSPHPRHDGLDELRRLVDVDPELGARYGLPLGLVRLGDRRPDQEEEYWIEAVLLVGDGICRIRAAAVPGLDLVRPPYDRLEFIAKACPDLPSRFRDPGIDIGPLQTDVSAILPGSRLRHGSATGTAVLQHAAGEIPLPMLMDDLKRRWVADVLVDQIWWHQPSGSVVRILPGDEATARAAAAMRLHRRIKRDAASVQNEPQAAWEAVVESVLASCPGGFKPTALNLQVAVASLRRFNDNALQRVLDAVEDAAELPA